MARIRSVKPEICESETMARLSAEVERTFVRLWTHCDDHGRCKDDPRLIVAALFPLHDDMTADVVDRHLTQLEDAGVIVRYSVGGKRFLACTSWSEHQHPQKPRPSKFPAPDDADTAAVQEVSRTPTRQVPDASSPVVGEGEVVGEGGNTSPELSLVPVDDAPATPERQNYPGAFETFWQECPRKTGKGVAAKAFQKATKGSNIAAQRITDAMRQHADCWARWPESERQFIPHPSTWLNEGRYDDPPPEPRAGSGDRAQTNRDRIAASVQRMTGGDQ